MSETSNEDYGSGQSSVEDYSNGQRVHSEALSEWRSSDQVENGSPWTSPPDIDEYGSNHSELYGKYTWKIMKYSEINEDSFRSGSFHVGGYEWYILIRPQRRDVDNHLSLHLCVANHEKLCPGWSNFVQFTIALVNKDPKKSIYTDTIHLFGKIEYNVQKKIRTVAHNWGWDMFIESPKLQEGYIDDLDSLVIKAQVQVIREEVDRPFRCLSSQYRRELVRVYLPTVEYNCGQFMRDKIISFGRLIQDKEEWQSFRSFWSRLDQNTRRKMSRDKMDVVLNLAAKNFFVMKQGATTLMMDSLYSGWKAIEGQTKTKDNVEFPDGPASIVSVDQDMLVLEDDLLSLMQKTVIAPFPINEEKVRRNDEEEYNKEAIMRDESRLTEVGRQTMEILALAHIYGNRVDVAYKEHMALKRQEQLIREEEEEKAKRGTTEKKTKSKKKQAKKKKNKKEKREEEKVDTEKEESVRAETESSAEKPDTLGDSSPVECELDASDAHHSPSGGRSSSISIPSGGRGRGSSISLPNESVRPGVAKGKVLNLQSKIWRRKEKSQPRKVSDANSLATEKEDQPSRHPSNPKRQSHSSETRRVGESDVVKTLNPKEHNPVSKDRGTVQTQEKSPAVFSPPKASPWNLPSVAQEKPEKRDVFNVETIPNKKPIPAGPPLLDQVSPSRDIQFQTVRSRAAVQHTISSKPSMSWPLTYIPQSYKHAVVGSLSSNHSSSQSTGTSTSLSVCNQSGFPVNIGSADVSSGGLLRSGGYNTHVSTSMGKNDVQVRRLTQNLMTDEFPHFDIINDLLEEEHGLMDTSGYRLPQWLNHVYSFLVDQGISGSEYMPDSSSFFSCLPYGNRQMNELIQQMQRQTVNMESSLLAMRRQNNAEASTYPYLHSSNQRLQRLHAIERTLRFLC